MLCLLARALSLLSELLIDLLVVLRRPLTLVAKSHFPQRGYYIACAKGGLLVAVTVKLIVLLRHTGAVLAMAAWLIALVKVDLIKNFVEVLVRVIGGLCLDIHLFESDFVLPFLLDSFTIY